MHKGHVLTVLRLFLLGVVAMLGIGGYLWFNNRWHTVLHVYYQGSLTNTHDPRFAAAANTFVDLSASYPSFTALNRWIAMAQVGNPNLYPNPYGDTTMHVLSVLALSSNTISMMLTLLLFGGVGVVIAIFFIVAYFNRKRFKTIMNQSQSDMSQTGVVPALGIDHERVLHPTRPRESTQSRPRVAPLFYDIGYGINRGIRRRSAVNQDSILAVRGGRLQQGRIEPFGVFIVADGMGGHLYGSEASIRATKVMLDYLVQPLVDGTELDDVAMLNLVKMSVSQANVDIHLRNLRKSADMGTTVTAAVVTGTHVIIVNVGDSRTYHLPMQGQIYPVTSDHSIVAGLVSAGLITPDEVYTHPRRNQIYRSLGEKDSVLIDSYTIDLDVGDSLILCSDGLWEMVRDNHIEDLVRHTSNAQEAADRLVDEANANGGVDNISAIVITVHETAEPNLQLGYSIVSGPGAEETE